MASIGLLPIDDDNREGQHGAFVTFVVPTPDGCNLRCPFCLVQQRQEIREAILYPDDLARFIRETALCIPIFALGIQGYEPLIPTSWDYAKSILETGQLLGLRTTLVTNGVFLRDAVEWLATLAPNSIAISLDAAHPAAHDRIRGVSGAWASTVRGVRRAVEVLSPRTSLAVASVLTSKRAPLEDMPSLLRDLGVFHWIITPLQRIGHAHPGGPTGNRDKLFENLLVLQQAADDAGIHLAVDDELDCLHHSSAAASRPELAKLRVRTLPNGVDLIRLTPNGQCYKNHDILRQSTVSAPRWQSGKIDAGRFVDGLTSTSPYWQ